MFWVFLVLEPVVIKLSLLVDVPQETLWLSVLGSKLFVKHEAMQDSLSTVREDRDED